MKIYKWFLVLAGILGLISVRFLEDKIFYDPFLQFFHEDYKNIPLPEFDWAKLILNYIFRFLLNLFFSSVIIHFVFLNKKWTFQAAVLMVLVFAITFPIYLFCIYDQFDIGFLISFYMRRFVIQPLVLLLIIPLFYYRKSLTKNVL